MRCPKCTEQEQVARVKNGKGKWDYLLACWGCPWQVTARELNAWLERWRNKK